MIYRFQCGMRLHCIANCNVVLLKNDLFIFYFFGFRFPFDCKHPVSYLVAICLQYIMTFYIFFVIASLVSLGIGAFILSILSSTEIKLYLDSVRRNAINEKTKLKSLKRLADFVDFHAEVKELSDILNFFFFLIYKILQHPLEWFTHFWNYFNQYLSLFFRGVLQQYA